MLSVEKVSGILYEMKNSVENIPYKKDLLLLYALQKMKNISIT